MYMDTDQFRQVLGRFASGVAIVTSRHGDEVHGTTVSAFCSVSLTPPLVLVCVDKAAGGHDMVARGKVFAVNILRAQQDDLSVALSSKGTPELEGAHRLEGIPYTMKVTGAPVLSGVHAYLDCTLVQSVEAGDHTIYVGQVEEAGTDGDDEPLLYYRGHYGRFLR